MVFSVRWRYGVSYGRGLLTPHCDGYGSVRRFLRTILDVVLFSTFIYTKLETMGDLVQCAVPLFPFNTYLFTHQQ